MRQEKSADNLRLVDWLRMIGILILKPNTKQKEASRLVLQDN